MKKVIIIPSLEDIIAINKELEKSFSVNEGALDFMISKIKSRRPSLDRKKDIAKGAATIWHDITVNHPFIDGNKRTATEAMLMFIDLNDYELKSPPNGLIYISLKLANNDISFNELVNWIYSRLKEIK
ncbi:MAG TPA: type II toxin-antitoxin system death-on-curing family toxin [Candidatus Altiarchaeales archaeon]|nr:type II toxin-antitoxin system death-on-curing family toxin [Candidatus Altiarchaeales archaeon]